jgi:peptidoglycan/LPS O-acetylase OafA/YrhL
VEEQFYLLLPLTMLLFLRFNAGKKAFYLVIFLFAFGLAIRMTSFNYFVAPNIEAGAFRLPFYKWIYYPTYNRLDGLLAGISVAGLFQFYPKLRQSIVRHGNFLFFAGLIVLAGAYFIGLAQFSLAASVFGFPLIALGFGCMVAAAVLPSSFLYKFKSRFTIHLAALSYAIYLSHKIVIHLVQGQFAHIGIDIDGNLMLCLCILTSWLIALLLRYMVEKPFLKLRGIILKKNKLQVSSPVAKITTLPASLVAENKIQL